jgi:sec-independent protein translocase protein TatC
MMNEENSEARGPFLSHLNDLFKSVKYFAGFLLIGASVGYFFSAEILGWLTLPYQKVMGDANKLIYLSPFEKVWVHLRIAFWSGMVFSAPALFWSLMRFVAPALDPQQNKTLNKMALALWLAICVGIFFAREYSIPVLLMALTSFKTVNETPFIALSPYVDMALGAVLATSLLFQLPLIMFFLSSLGWVTQKNWSDSRKIAIIFNAVISAILSPPDAISMLILMVPIQILYEVGIIATRLGESLRTSKT